VARNAAEAQSCSPRMPQGGLLFVAGLWGYYRPIASVSSPIGIPPLCRSRWARRWRTNRRRITDLLRSEGGRVLR